MTICALVRYNSRTWHTQTDGQTDGQTDRQTDGQTIGYSKENLKIHTGVPSLTLLSPPLLPLPLLSPPSLLPLLSYISLPLQVELLKSSYGV